MVRAKGNKNAGLIKKDTAWRKGTVNALIGICSLRKARSVCIRRRLHRARHEGQDFVL
jgi:hypothetical protein